MKMKVSNALVLFSLLNILPIHASEKDSKYNPTPSDAKSPVSSSCSASCSVSSAPNSDAYELRKSNRPILERFITGGSNYTGHDLLRDLKAMQPGNTVSPDDTKSMANVLAAIGDIKTRNDFEQAAQVLPLLYDRKVHVEQAARRALRHVIKSHRDNHGTATTSTTLEALKKAADQARTEYGRIMNEFEAQQKVYAHNDKLLGTTYKLCQEKQNQHMTGQHLTMMKNLQNSYPLFHRF